MIRRERKTISESVFSDKYDFVELAKTWRSDAITVLLNLVWQACDVYQYDVLSRVDLSQVNDQLERDITQGLSIEIDRVKSGDVPFTIRTEWFEMEGREPSPARPKQYDLAFIWSKPPNVRIVWPIEAKILSSDGSISEYVKEITNNYLTCRYAPFSSEGGMLGYLLKGDCAKVFRNIEKAISCQLTHYPAFQEREHKTSDHQRIVPPNKSYPIKFRCHHLVLQLTKNSDLNHDEKITSDGPKNIDVKN
jgi:hypothetical protein